MKSKKSPSLRITSRSRHAVMAMVELAQKSQGDPVPLSKIAASGNISLSYLEQLFAGLRRHGLVKSYRGPGGGYILAKPAAQIGISEILISAEDCVPAGRNNANDDFGNDQTNALWSHIGDMLQVVLQHVSLEDVTNDNLGAHPVTNKLFESLR